MGPEEMGKDSSKTFKRCLSVGEFVLERGWIQFPPEWASYTKAGII